MEIYVLLLCLVRTTVFSSPLQDGNDDNYIFFSNQSAKYWSSGLNVDNWENSKSTCELSGGTLAYPRTQEEAEILTSFFYHGTPIWVGQIATECDIDTYGTITNSADGTTFSIYELFRSQRTYGDTNDVRCLILIRAWGVQELMYESCTCDYTQSFVCRKLIPTEDSNDLFTTELEPDYTEIPSTSPPPPPPQPLSHRFRADYEHYSDVSDEAAYYKVHNSALNWDNASASCSDEGAELMYPRSVEELQLMQSLLGTKPQVWLGAHSQHTFHTSDGRQSDILSKQLLPELPLDFAVSFWEVEGGRMQWLSTSVVLPFVCNKRDESLILDGNCDTTVPGYERSPDGRSCYKVHALPRTWREAHSSCQAEHTTLAVVNSRSEAEHLIGLARHAFLPGEEPFVFIGFHDLIVPNAYETSNGKSLRAAGYNTWWENSSRGSYYQGSCGVLRNDATLDTLDCNMKAIFICEKELTPAAA